MSFQIRSYEITLSAATPVQVTGGKYFTIEDSESDMTLRFKGQTGEEVGRAENVAAGFWCDVEQFGSIEIESAAAQTISVIVGSGSGPVRFGVNKTSTSITGGTLTPRTLIGEGLIVGKVTVNAAVSTMVLPSSNTNGMQIDGIIWGKISGTSYAAVLTKSSTPTNYLTDVNARNICHYDAATQIVQAVPMPFIVPAGEGLYYGGSVAASAYLQIQYRLL